MPPKAWLIGELSRIVWELINMTKKARRGAPSWGDEPRPLGVSCWHKASPDQGIGAIIHQVRGY